MEVSTIMTRKQALHKAIKILSNSKENTEIIQLLQDIYDELPLIHWSDKSIRDTVEQFIIDNGRNPTATDFKRRGMPPHPVIKQKYKITLGEWLELNYPTKKLSYEKRKEQYTKDFLENYYRIKPKTSEEFNNKRKEGTKSWQTVAVHYNIKSWRALLKTFNLPIFVSYNIYKPMEIQVNIYSDYNFDNFKTQKIKV